jgi:hypothetical protein
MLIAEALRPPVCCDKKEGDPCRLTDHEHLALSVMLAHVLADEVTQRRNLRLARRFSQVPVGLPAYLAPVTHN